MTSPTTPSSTTSSSFLDSSTFVDIFSGSASGVIAKFAEYPADTIKSRMQYTAGKTTLQVCKDIINTEKIRGFYRGVSMPMLGCAAECSLTFALFHSVIDSMLVDGNKSKVCWWSPFGDSLQKNRDEHSFKTVATASFIAGIANGFLLTPIEVVKCRCQVNPAKYKNVRQCIRVSFKEEGLRAFSSGAAPTFVREILGTMSFFLALELAMTVFFSQYRVSREEAETSSDDASIVVGDLKSCAPWYVRPVSGGCAGFGLMIVPYFFDTTKTIMQTSEKYSKMGMWNTISDVYKNHGMKYFYRGLPVTLPRAFFGNAIVFSVYDICSHKMISASEARRRKNCNSSLEAQQLQQQSMQGMNTNNNDREIVYSSS